MGYPTGDHTLFSGHFANFGASPMQQLGHLTRSRVVVAAPVVDESPSHGIGLVELRHVLSANPPKFLECRRKVSRFRDELTREAEGMGVVSQIEGF